MTPRRKKVKPMNSLINLTPQQLRRAADLQERIVGLRNDLAALLGAVAPTAPPVPPAPTRGKRRISAAGIERIRAAQRARWAKAHAAQRAPTDATRKQQKRRMSPEARAKIAERMKAVWAARRGKR
jgi:hypothetical protein